MKMLNNFLTSSMASFLIIVLTFPLNVTFASPITVLNLPEPGSMVGPSEKFTPIIVRGITVYPNDPFKFDFIIDSGNAQLSNQVFDQEATKLIKYFLASLTTPEKDMWVNLSPYEKDRIIPQNFGITEMGRDLLAQDYILKQLTSSLIYPEKQLGKEFWSKVYVKAQKLYGTTQIPFNTFNKVWIVPNKAVVWEHNQSAYVAESHLKVMLEQDYLSLKKHVSLRGGEADEAIFKRTADQKIASLPTVVRNDMGVSTLGSSVVREILLPAIEKEVNEGKNFALLRQVYNSVILATWYKKNLQTSILGQIYINKNKDAGVDVVDKQIKQKIYQQYLEAFKKGAYNYVKEEFDPTVNQTVSRKYFSGGTEMAFPDGAMIVENQPVAPHEVYDGAQAVHRVTAELVDAPKINQEYTLKEILLPDGTINRQSMFWPKFAELINAYANAAMTSRSADLPVAQGAETPVRVAINGGSGRIGINLLRATLEGPYNMSIVALNDLTFANIKSQADLDDFIRLIKADFSHSNDQDIRSAEIKSGEDDHGWWIQINGGHKIRLFAEKEPQNLPWSKLDIDVVYEATGRFTNPDKARLHLDAGAKKVIITAPSTDEVTTIVAGVNTDMLDRETNLCSAASCTTGSIAPVLKVINDEFGIEHFYIVTTHSYTADQAGQPLFRPGAQQRGMPAAENIIPTTTGAAKAIGLVIPELAGKGDGKANRIPTPNGSLTDITLIAKKKVTVQEINDALRRAAKGALKGIMAVHEGELISSEILGRTESSIVQLNATRVLGDNMVTVAAWYDNEYGYSNRALDLGAVLTRAPGADLKPGHSRESDFDRPIPPAIAQAIKGDKAMNGGINLDAAMLDLQVKRDGYGVILPISQQPMNRLKSINGFTPRIIKDEEINLLEVLGIGAK